MAATVVPNLCVAGDEPASSPDLEEISRAQHGERYSMERLLSMYRGLVHSIARRFTMYGLDFEDLTQVGMIGLWHAIMQFRCDRAVSFTTYATLCIRRQIISAIKARMCLKRRGDIHPLSLESDLTSEHAADPIVGSGSGTSQDPIDLLISWETCDELYQALKDVLSPAEWQVLIRHVQGCSYREIASELQCSVKSVDNAMSRVRRKAHAVAEVPYAWQGPVPASGGERRSGTSRRRTPRRRLANGFRSAQAAL